MSTHLLVIDPQNDFCDLPADWCPLDPVTQSPHGPALPVPGAHRDLLRLSEWMQRQCRRIDGITVTLDSHQQLDIAHPGFWMTAGGDDVRPFQVVTVDDLQQKRIQPRDSSLSEEVQAYVEALESQGRYQLMIWPVHCQIGTWGHNLHDAVLAATNHWERQQERSVQFVFKGTNRMTEHYSALRAEVPREDDPTTQWNWPLIERLDQAASIMIAGQASSHCVRATVEHLVSQLPSGNPAKMTLLTDCMSPVAGFEAEAEAFLQSMQRLGVACRTTGEVQ